MTLRTIRPGDRGAVLALNAASVEHLSPLDGQRLATLLGWAHQGQVLEVEGVLAGFVLVFAPGSPYDSVNYRWFAQRYRDFLYLDRVVVAAPYRRQGHAGVIYDAVEAAARPFGRLVCEVNADPPNPASMAFHLARGFVEVGRLAGPDGKIVAMLAKELAVIPGRASRHR